MNMAMRKIILTAWLICFLCSDVWAQETVRFAIGEWEPHYSEQYKHYGLVPHIISEAFAQEGIKVEYGFFPWSRSMGLVKQGLWDATCCWSKTDERAQFYFFSDSVIDEKQVFFHLKEFDFDWHGMESLKGVIIGTGNEFYHGHPFHKAEQKGGLRIEKLSVLEKNFEKLLAKRIDVFPMDEIAGYAAINKKFKPEVASMFTHHPRVLDSMPQRALFSKKVSRSKALIEKLNKGLEALKTSGRYQEFEMDFQNGKYQ